MEAVPRPRIGTTVTPAVAFSTSVKRTVMDFLVRREEEDCHPEGGIDRCKKPWISSKVTWVVVGVLAGLIVLVTLSVLLFLHFRGRRRERQEDLEDRFRAADYGLDELPGGGKKKRRRQDDEVSSPNDSPVGYGMRTLDPLHVGSEPKYPPPGHLSGRKNTFGQ
ncbi:hypothetical protein VTH82DRAFT_6216 [Thermothelomyces myriococcoides]